MRLAIVNHLGDVGAGAEHALLQYLVRLPAHVEPRFFFFEDGAFAQSMRERFGAVTIVPMSPRVAAVKRSALPIHALADSIWLTLRLRAKLSEARPDMVLTNTMKAHIIGSLAAKLAGLPCVNYIHDIVNGPALEMLRTVSRTCAVERVTCSQTAAVNLRLPRTTPVYAPIETALFRELPERRAARSALGLPADDLPVVAVVGRIARWKGQDRFIRIAIDVLRDTPAHFAIVGSPIFGCDADYVSELMAAAVAAGCSHRIHFVPWQADMRNVYAAIDVACNTSTREPFGRTSLEALASGVPVVCFDDAGICEIFAGEPAGTPVPAGDERAFARAVRSYLVDEQFAARAKERARFIAEPLDIANAYRAFADVIERVGMPAAARPADATPLVQTTSSFPR